MARHLAAIPTEHRFDRAIAEHLYPTGTRRNHAPGVTPDPPPGFVAVTTHDGRVLRLVSEREVLAWQALNLARNLKAVMDEIARPLFPRRGDAL